MTAVIWLAISCAKPAGPPQATAPQTASPAPDAAKAAEPARVLATVPSTRPGLRFDLLRGPCDSAGCKLVVRATGKDVKAAELTLGWPLPTGPVAPVEDAPAPLPFALDHGARKQWQIGSEERSATLSATPVAVGEAAGLLLRAEVGFEHVKRLHALVTLVGDRLMAPWARDDGAGPHVSDAGPLATAAGLRLVHFDAFEDPTPTEPDSLAVRVIDPSGRAGEAQAQAKERSPREAGLTVYAAVTGPFASVASARKARAQRECLRDSLVLPAARFAGERGRGFVLAAVASQQAMAEPLARRLSSCAGTKARVSHWKDGS